MGTKYQEYQEAVLCKSILKVSLCARQCVGCKHQNRDLSASMHFLCPQLTSLRGTNSVSKPPRKSLWPNQTGSSLSPCGHRIKQMAGSVLDASCHSRERAIARHHKPRNAANPGATCLASSQLPYHMIPRGTGKQLKEHALPNPALILTQDFIT